MITRMQLRSSSSRTFTCRPSAHKYTYRLRLRSRRVHSRYSCSTPSIRGSNLYFKGCAHFISSTTADYIPPSSLLFNTPLRPVDWETRCINVTAERYASTSVSPIVKLSPRMHLDARWAPQVAPRSARFASSGGSAGIAKEKPGWLTRRRAPVGTDRAASRRPLRGPPVHAGR